MVDRLLNCLLVLSSLSFVATQRSGLNISQGSSLTPTGNLSWLSPSGLYAFGFYEQGNSNLYRVGIFLAGVSEKTVVWTANRDSPPVSSSITLILTTDGRLVLQQQSGASSTDVVTLDQSISTAAMLDSGNFVVYDSNKKKLWQSFDHPTDTILPGQPLLNDQELFSSMSETDHSTGTFRLKMQSDSNLVLYAVETWDSAYTDSFYWDSDTFGKGVNITLNLDPDGHLYLLDNSTTVLYNLTGGFSGKQKICLMKLDVDGIMRLYSFELDKKENSSSVEWASSYNKCDAKGLCGLNSFCTINDDEAKCVCLPGFDFITPGNFKAGCERIYTAVSCKNKDKSMEYRMSSLENIEWQNDPYFQFRTTVKDDCEAACLKDCNCVAAFYIDLKCSKQRLPLRYGRKIFTDFNNIVFIKLASTTPAKEVPIDSSTKKNPPLNILIISLSLFALACTIFVISGLVVYKNRIRAYKRIASQLNVELMEDIVPQSFPYVELEKLTNGFQEEIGRGASGTVYKGTLEFNNKVVAVAVKRLESMLAQGEREFKNEMKVIGRTHHRNLVRLLGYSHDGPKKLLVYEYMVNGSLADVIFKAQIPPRWDERIKIALDIARGILYLHEECETQIIHCDIKPQNILIDEYRSARISDFGLAKLLKPDQENTYTGIRGTRGYVAPEWHRKTPVTVKADVYSYGILFLEIICCRKSLDMSLAEEKVVLEDWVIQCFEKNELAELIVDEETDKTKFERMVRIGLWCILDEPSLRPSMKRVLLMLEGTVDIPVPPSLSSYLTAI
ncbi:G-type lectin S-receptor-like serine/threonine-protein kinase LECRK3 [Apium graveolens]|uniref:G-type lectin S-receptor-like serine/threonine-protein kinase LECRK3 n=1 Tax=Apium graveolens TaxID=4045 RepID=UPI003D7B1330